MKSTIFGIVTPSSLVEIDLHFGGTYRLYLQGLIVSQAKNQGEADCKKTSAVVRYCVSLKLVT
jgi:hypothetical protein